MCPICGRELKRRKVDNFVFACAGCGTHFSRITFMPIDEDATHCRYCHALIDRRLSIDGIGLVCGCLGEAYKILKRFANDNGYEI